MQIFGKKLDADVAIVAEIGVNHEGDVEAASRMVRLAAESGADAVKFQSYTAERYAAATDPARLERVRRFGLDEAAHRRLAAEAKEHGIHFFSTPVSEDWVPLIAELSPAIKIASGDLTFGQVIRAAAATGLPVIISTGLGTLEEIDQAVDWMKEGIGTDALSDRLILMQCVSAYPTPVEEANVLSIPFLRDRYGVEVGFSNHVIGPEACYAAIAVGAPLIEVHFTEQKEGRDFHDHALSFDPKDLSHFVQTAKAIRAALGIRDKQRQPSELPLLPAVRKGIVAARNLTAGTILGLDDLMFARTNEGLPTNQVDMAVGKTLASATEQGMPIGPDAFTG